MVETFVQIETLPDIHRHCLSLCFKRSQPCHDYKIHWLNSTLFFFHLDVCLSTRPYSLSPLLIGTFQQVLKMKLNWYCITWASHHNLTWQVKIFLLIYSRDFYHLFFIIEIYYCRDVLCHNNNIVNISNKSALQFYKNLGTVV